MYHQKRIEQIKENENEEYEYNNNNTEYFYDEDIDCYEEIYQEELYGLLNDTETTQITIRRKIKKIMKM